MQYMMLICGQDHPEAESAEAADDRLDSETQAWVDEMDARGVRLSGNRLRSTRSATTVRVRDGEVLLSDGPFAETKEQMLGYDLLECADLDEAIEIASKHPSARFGPIEVRPVWL